MLPRLLKQRAYEFIVTAVRAARKSGELEARRDDKEVVLSELHSPAQARAARHFYFMNQKDWRTGATQWELPVPPATIRASYAIESDEHFVGFGLKTATQLRAALAETNSELDGNSAILDWGCASGRVLRHFLPEAKAGAEVWGIDQDEPHILWAKANLSPPFKFMVCNAYPHLPFEDNTFSFIYGISIFTHLEHFVDTWLMELRRVMRPGGIAMFTINNEATVNYFKQQGRPVWLDESVDYDALLAHDWTTVSGAEWWDRHIFYKTGFVRESWGQYFEVIDIKDCFLDVWQTLVVLRKRET